MKAFFVLILIALVVCAWCPWLEKGEAKQLIVNKVRESQSTLIDGCKLSIQTQSLEKVLFGYKQKVKYDCTVNADFLTDGENIVFVTFFKEVMNVPHPVIK